MPYPNRGQKASQNSPTGTLLLAAREALLGLRHTGPEAAALHRLNPLVLALQRQRRLAGSTPARRSIRGIAPLVHKGLDTASRDSSDMSPRAQIHLGARLPFDGGVRLRLSGHLPFYNPRALDARCTVPFAHNEVHLHRHSHPACPVFRE